MDDEYKERPSLFGHVNNLLNYCWLALARQHTAYYSCQSGKKSKILPDVRSEPCAVDFYPGQFRNNNHAHIIWLSYHQLGSTPEITMQTGIWHMMSQQDKRSRKDQEKIKFSSMENMWGANKETLTLIILEPCSVLPRLSIPFWIYWLHLSLPIQTVILDFFLLKTYYFVVHIKYYVMNSVLTWKKINKCHTVQLPVATTVLSVMFFVEAKLKKIMLIAAWSELLNCDS